MQFGLASVRLSIEPANGRVDGNVLIRSARWARDRSWAVTARREATWESLQRPSEVAAYDAPETLARYPLGRIAEPIDIACAALFLASDAANGITGQVLNVDCGASA